jgi:DNA replication protein DnaC
MLTHQTIAKLGALGLSAMADGLTEQLAMPGTYDELSFSDRLGLLVDKEADARDSRRLATRLKAAKLRYPASVEDVDFRAPRGLDRSVVLSLAEARFVAARQNVVITGATGRG